MAMEQAEDIVRALMDRMPARVRKYAELSLLEKYGLFANFWESIASEFRECLREQRGKIAQYGVTTHDVDIAERCATWMVWERDMEAWKQVPENVVALRLYKDAARKSEADWERDKEESSRRGERGPDTPRPPSLSADVQRVLSTRPVRPDRLEFAVQFVRVPDDLPPDWPTPTSWQWDLWLVAMLEERREAIARREVAEC